MKGKPNSEIFISKMDLDESQNEEKKNDKIQILAGERYTFSNTEMTPINNAKEFERQASQGEKRNLKKKHDKNSGLCFNEFRLLLSPSNSLPVKVNESQNEENSDLRHEIKNSNPKNARDDKNLKRKKSSNTTDSKLGVEKERHLIRQIFVFLYRYIKDLMEIVLFLRAYEPNKMYSFLLKFKPTGDTSYLEHLDFQDPKLRVKQSSSRSQQNWKSDDFQASIPKLSEKIKASPKLVFGEFSDGEGNPDFFKPNNKDLFERFEQEDSFVHNKKKNQIKDKEKKIQNSQSNIIHADKLKISFGKGINMERPRDRERISCQIEGNEVKPKYRKKSSSLLSNLGQINIPAEQINDSKKEMTNPFDVNVSRVNSHNNQNVFMCKKKTSFNFNSDFFSENPEIFCKSKLSGFLQQNEILFLSSDLHDVFRIMGGDFDFISKQHFERFFASPIWHYQPC